MKLSHPGGDGDVRGGGVTGGTAGGAEGLLHVPDAPRPGGSATGNLRLFLRI